jgi:site-specific DNA-methyltransferase (adenine-specific)|tara:strand:+ start:248 stop:1135 length:888 start_codon:yes stop_codon:yes gene_type:complete
MNIDILHGDCIETLQKLDDKSINTCITSPPYWGLRNYNDEEKQLGLEDTPEKFVNNLVKVFREVKRVLRDDGTVWLNLGDSYMGGGGGNYNKTGISQAGGQHLTNVRNRKDFIKKSGVKAKDLVGIPFRVALALQQDGWYLRQDIIWHKPNPMPESVKDRCTKAHEYIFLLSKNQKYYFDNEAIKEDCITKSKQTNKKNKRSVWTVPTKPFKEAHFATFPMDLIEPCVLAGCPEGGTVLDPFGGSGTTGIVAVNHNRNAVLCELNQEYIEIAKNRINEQAGFYADTKIKKINNNI